MAFRFVAVGMAAMPEAPRIIRHVQIIALPALLHLRRKPDPDANRESHGRDEDLLRERIPGTFMPEGVRLGIARHNQPQRYQSEGPSDSDECFHIHVRFSTRSGEDKAHSTVLSGLGPHGNQLLEGALRACIPILTQ